MVIVYKKSTALPTKVRENDLLELLKIVIIVVIGTRM